MSLYSVMDIAVMSGDVFCCIVVLVWYTFHVCYVFNVINGYYESYYSLIFTVHSFSTNTVVISFFRSLFIVFIISSSGDMFNSRSSTGE